VDLLHAAAYTVNGVHHYGKIHGVREGERSYCGQELRYTGGMIQPGRGDQVTCKGCLRSIGSQERQHQQREEFEQQRAGREADQERESQEWWAWYSSYLASPEWASKRTRVLKRAAMLCEGCRLGPPVHIHHLTYEHAGDEFLYELVALCVPCHQKAHPSKEIGA